MTEDNHYNASSLTEATLSLRSLYKQTQTKMNERHQLLESSGNFFARSMEVSSVLIRRIINEYASFLVATRF